MRRCIHIVTYVVLILGSSLILLFPHTLSYLKPIVVIEEPAIVKEEPPVTILYTGDIMLGRHVEVLMERHDPLYPFIGIQDVVASATIAVGNFEGTVPEVHVPTPSRGMQFSIQDAYLDTLASIGFDVLSLANNHSSDLGRSAYINTKKHCVRLEIQCHGSGTGIGEDDIYIYENEGTRVGMLFLHTLYGLPEESVIQDRMEYLRDSSDIQVLYVHWGEEYALTHSKAQEDLARLFIAEGVDAIIGHHPHVVQDIVVYENVPIFYSLGNLIFDQYFSEDVQEGLLVYMKVSSSSLSFTLHALSSIKTPSQPHILSHQDEEALLKRVLGDIYPRYRDEGALVFERD